MTFISGPLPFDQDAAKTFLALLGKPPHLTRLRGFLPTGHPLKTQDPGRKGHFSAENVTTWQQEGRGVYAVINNGGDIDANIASCNALFVEWDDRPVDWQIQAWKELSLPEPSFIVLTGGKSVHVYWRFTSPIGPETWRDLQTRLLEYADADRTLKNPSRVMRLPGAWHLGPDGTPNGQTVILGQPSGRSYTVDDFEALLPTKELVREQDQARSFRVPFDFPSHSLGEIQEALHCIPEAVPNEGQYPFFRNLTWGLIKACEEVGGTREDAIAFMSAHSPRFAEVRQVARSTFSHVNASTFWYHAQKHGYRSPKANGGLDAFSSAQRRIDAKEAAEAEQLAYSELINLLVEAYKASDMDAEAEITVEIKNRFKRSDGQIISSVLRALTPHTKGEQARTVNLDNVISLEYAADGWIIRGKPQLLYASYGGGKTTLLVEKAIAICEGRSLIERQTINHTPGKALIIATDSGVQALKTTFQQLQYEDHPSLNPSSPQLFIWGQCTEQGVDAWVADVPGILRLRRFVEEEGITYVAIDSVKTVCAGGGFSYTDNDAVNNFVTLIDRTICEPFGCCVEFISHTGVEKGAHSGAKAWAESPSMVCRLTPAYEENSQDGGQNTQRKQIGVLAEFLKDRASESGKRSIAYRLNTDLGLLQPLPEVEVVGSCKDAIVQILSEAHERGQKGLRLADMASEAQERFGRSWKTVQNTLTALTAGRTPTVVRLKGQRGRYALAPRLRDAPFVSCESQDEPSRTYRDTQETVGGFISKSIGMTEVSNIPSISRRDEVGMLRNVEFIPENPIGIKEDFPKSTATPEESPNVLPQGGVSLMGTPEIAPSPQHSQPAVDPTNNDEEPLPF